MFDYTAKPICAHSERKAAVMFKTLAMANAAGSRAVDTSEMRPRAKGFQSHRKLHMECTECASNVHRMCIFRHPLTTASLHPAYPAGFSATSRLTICCCPPDDRFQSGIQDVMFAPKHTNTMARRFGIFDIIMVARCFFSAFFFLLSFSHWRHYD